MRHRICDKDVIKTTQNEERNWKTVRIAGELMTPLEKLVENAKDQYGIPLFRSKADAVTQAVKEFLEKHTGKEA